MSQMCVEALGVTKRELEDFLPGGKFEDMDECMKEQLMHCPLTNLVEILILMFVKEGMHLYTLDPLCTVLKEIRLLSSFRLKVDLR